VPPTDWARVIQASSLLGEDDVLVCWALIMLQYLC
jgi:hypothetical protein